MIGVIGTEEPEPEGSVVKDLAAGLFECLLEAQELLPYAVILLIVGFGIYLVADMVYQLVFDPNAVDVASRLDALSVDPDKWFRLS